VPLTDKQRAAAGRFKGWAPWKKRSAHKKERPGPAAIHASQQFVAAMRGTVPCASCKRLSSRRVGETQARRPIDWYPLDGGPRRIDRMARGGASVEALQEEMGRSLALCSSCKRRRKP
jgi:hypothetical protein